MARTTEALRLNERLSALDLPERQRVPVRGPGDLLHAIAASGLRPRGYYFADPRMLRRLFWWQNTPTTAVQRWRDELVTAGELTIEPLAMCCYSPGVWVDVVALVQPQRFPRFAARSPISPRVRELVYRRDGYRCVTCASTEKLSLDHIIPWSLGGSDDPSNLQTMCRPCNSRKGVRV